jgi:hypothetical protein
MKILFGKYEFDLRNCEKISTSFPLTFSDKVVTTVVDFESVSEQDLLSHYACGDTMGNMGQHIASTECLASPVHKIILSIELQRKDGKPEIAQCTAVACLEHSHIILLRTLFLTGLLTGLTAEAAQDDTDDTEESS